MSSIKLSNIHIRLFIVFVALIPLLLSSAVIYSQSSGGPEGACAITGEQLYGQGGWAFASQGGWAFASQGGWAFASQEGGTMTEPTGSEYDKVLEQIVANTVDASWIQLHSDAVGTGLEPVGVLVIDDFSGPTAHGVWVRRIYEEMYSYLVRAYVEGRSDVPPPPLAIVNIPLNLIDFDVNRLGTAPYDLEAIMNQEHQVRFFSGKGEPEIQYREINHWVMNMSFALLPCSDPDLGWIFAGDKGGDFRDYFEQARANWLEGNGNEGTPNVSIFDYLLINQGLFGGDFNSAVDYLANIMLEDSSDFDKFKSYLETLNQIPEKTVVQVASAGNYREWMLDILGFECYFDPSNTGDNGKCQPFAPGRWDMVIASAATMDPDPEKLGVPILSSTDPGVRDTQQFVNEDTQMWLSSQDGQLITPGAWYLYDFDGPYVPPGGFSPPNDDWYRSGTSFSTPFLGMGWVMQLSHREQLNCEGTFQNGVPLVSEAAGSKQINALPSFGVICPMNDIEREFYLNEGVTRIDPKELILTVTESDPNPDPGQTIGLSIQLENASSEFFATGARVRIPNVGNLSNWSTGGVLPGRGFIYTDPATGDLIWFIGTLPANSAASVYMDFSATVANPPSNKLIEVLVGATARELYGERIEVAASYNVEGTISGMVQDELGQAMRQILVTASPGGLSTCTNGAGNYSFTGIDASSLTVTAVGNQAPCVIGDYTFLQNTSWSPSNTTNPPVDLSGVPIQNGVNLSFVPDIAPVAVSNINPTGDVLVSGVTFNVTWSPVAGASRYRVFVRDEDTNGTYGAIEDVTLQELTVSTATDICAGTLCSHTFTTPPNGRYSVWIQSINNVGAAWNGPHYFRVGSAPLPPSIAPVILSPPHVTLDTTADMTWASVPNATMYDVLVYEYQTATWVVIDSNVPIGLLGRCVPTCLYHILHTAAQEEDPRVGFTPGNTYALFGRAKGPGGFGPYSRAYIVNVPVNAVPSALAGESSLSTLSTGVPAQATVTSPTGASSNSTPTITWQDTGDASSYRLAIQTVSGTVFDQTALANDWCVAGICSVSLSSPLAVGDYQANVHGINYAGNGAWSNPSLFSIIADTDADGIEDSLDNCPTLANADQLDSDADGLGDVCDATPLPQADSDADGIVDSLDNCPTLANADQLDADGDGLGDVCDDTPTPEPVAPIGDNTQDSVAPESTQEP